MLAVLEEFPLEVVALFCEELFALRALDGAALLVVAGLAFDPFEDERVTGLDCAALVRLFTFLLAFTVLPLEVVVVALVRACGLEVARRSFLIFLDATERFTRDEVFVSRRVLLCTVSLCNPLRKAVLELAIDDRPRSLDMLATRPVFARIKRALLRSTLSRRPLLCAIRPLSGRLKSRRAFL